MIEDDGNSSYHKQQLNHLDLGFALAFRSDESFVIFLSSCLWATSLSTDLVALPRPKILKME